MNPPSPFSTSSLAWRSLAWRSISYGEGHCCYYDTATSVVWWIWLKITNQVYRKNAPASICRNLSCNRAVSSIRPSVCLSVSQITASANTLILGKQMKDGFLFDRAVGTNSNWRWSNFWSKKKWINRSTNPQVPKWQLRPRNSLLPRYQAETTISVTESSQWGWYVCCTITLL